MNWEIQVPVEIKQEDIDAGCKYNTLSKALSWDQLKVDCNVVGAPMLTMNCPGARAIDRVLKSPYLGEVGGGVWSIYKWSKKLYKESLDHPDDDYSPAQVHIGAYSQPLQNFVRAFDDRANPEPTTVWLTIPAKYLKKSVVEKFGKNQPVEA